MTARGGLAVAGLIAALAIGRGLLFVALTPAYQGADELWHLDYARVLAGADLPVLGETPLGSSIVADVRAASGPGRPEHGLDAVPKSREAAQPPLAYVLPSLGWAVLPAPREALYFFRVIDVAIGAGIAVMAFVLGRTAFPGSLFGAGAAAAVVIGLPSIGVFTATATNEAALVLCSLAVLALAARIARDGGTPRAAAVLGGAIGVTTLVKASGWLMLGPGLVAVLLAPPVAGAERWWRRGWRAAVLVVTTCAVAAPWVVRNLAVYGDPVGTSAYASFGTVPGRTIGGIALFAGAAPADPRARSFWPALGETSVGVLGWTDVYLPSWAYWLAGVTALAAVATVAWWLRAAPVRDRRAAVVLASALVAGVVGVAAYSHVVDYQPQGRYVATGLTAAAATAGAAGGRNALIVVIAVGGALLMAAVLTSLNAYA